MLIISILIGCTSNISNLSVEIIEPGSLILAKWDQKKDQLFQLEYYYSEKWIRTPIQHYEKGENYQVIPGIPFDRDVKVRIPDEFGGSELQNITTDPLPDNLPLANVVINISNNLIDNYFLTSIGPEGGWAEGQYWVVIINRKGEYVWAWPAEFQKWTMSPTLSNDNSSILFDQGTYWSQPWEDDPGADGVISEISLDGKDLNEFSTPGIHHQFELLSDDRIIYGRAKKMMTEILTEISPDGSIREFYSTGELSFQFNTIHSYNNSLVCSSYPDDKVRIIGLDGKEEVEWGENTNWKIDGYQFFWQHGARITNQGNLLLSAHNNEQTDETFALEYKINWETETLTEVWSFGDGLESQEGGEAVRSKTGNTYHCYGTNPVIKEITPDQLIVWEVNWGEDRLLGKMTPLNNLWNLANGISL